MDQLMFNNTLRKVLDSGRASKLLIVEQLQGCLII